MEREQLVGPGFGDERLNDLCMRWRCRAAHCMRAAISRRRAAAAANYIAQWNGSSWSPLGSGIQAATYGPYVSALAVSGSTLYAAAISRRRAACRPITSRNGTGAVGRPWVRGLGGDGYSHVNALAVSGSTLYAGGNFTTAGGSAANYIAQWNGSSWSALGSGMNSDVYALAVSGSTLYAGGNFTTAGGSTGQLHRAMEREQLVGPRFGDEQSYVNALAVSGSTLYAGGDFTTAGGTRPITSRNGTGAVGRRWVRG